MPLPLAVDDAAAASVVLKRAVWCNPFAGAGLKADATPSNARRTAEDEKFMCAKGVKKGGGWGMQVCRVCFCVACQGANPNETNCSHHDDSTEILRLDTKLKF